MHFILSTISHFKINEHKFVTSDNEILAECEAFYTELHENVIYRLKVNFFRRKTTSSWTIVTQRVMKDL